MWGAPDNKEVSAVAEQVSLPPNGQYVDVPFSPADDPWVTEAGVPLPGASLRIYAFYTTQGNATPDITPDDVVPDTTAAADAPRLKPDATSIPPSPDPLPV